MKLLLTGAFQYSALQLQTLEALGYEITFVQDERLKLDIDVSSFDAVVCNGLFVRNDIADFKSLKAVQLLSAGTDRVPVKYMEEHGIRLYNAAGVYSVPIAEFILKGILDVYKNTRFFFENQNACRWEKHRGLLELDGKTALIFGAGSIGTETAKRLKAFGVYIVGADLQLKLNPYFDSIVHIEEAGRLLPDADIVIIAMPLTEKTQGYFDAGKLTMMKRNALLVNTARGKIVNESDLIQALKDNRLLGAVLDVFEEEPLSVNSPLWCFDNVIITPHNSFVGENNNQRMFDVIISNLTSMMNQV